MNGCAKVKKNIEIIIKKIERFIPQNDGWYELEEALEELYNSNNPELGLNAMLSIYERYPDEDNDILWGMLHGIEEIKDYETKIIESIKRKPSFFGVLIINRMLNDGVTTIDNIKLIDILNKVIDNPSSTDYIKQKAIRFLERHSK